MHEGLKDLANVISHHLSDEHGVKFLSKEVWQYVNKGQSATAYFEEAGEGYAIAISVSVSSVAEEKQADDEAKATATGMPLSHSTSHFETVKLPCPPAGPIEQMGLDFEAHPAPSMEPTVVHLTKRDNPEVIFPVRDMEAHPVPAEITEVARLGLEADEFKRQRESEDRNEDKHVRQNGSD